MRSLLDIQEELQKAILCQTHPPKLNIEHTKRYQQTFLNRLADFLVAEFPSTNDSLGDKFEKISRDFILKHPSHYVTIRDVSLNFPDYLASINEPFASELAHIELTINRSVIAENSNPLTTEDLTNLSEDEWGNLKLFPNKSLCCHSFKTNALTSYSSREESGSHLLPKKLTEPVLCWFWRNNNQVHYLNFSKEFNIFIKLIIKNATFTECCEELLNIYSDENEAVTIAGQMLYEAINLGLCSKN